MLRMCFTPLLLLRLEHALNNDFCYKLKDICRLSSSWSWKKYKFPKRAIKVRWELLSSKSKFNQKFMWNFRLLCSNQDVFSPKRFCSWLAISEHSFSAIFRLLWNISFFQQSFLRQNLSISKQLNANARMKLNRSTKA